MEKNIPLPDNIMYLEPVEKQMLGEVKDAKWCIKPNWASLRQYIRWIKFFKKANKEIVSSSMDIKI